jgi:hypothetical protein
MKIFQIPFSIANEVVKRSLDDNRRELISPLNGGNNLFYLGTPNQFIEKFENPLRERLIQVQTLCNERFGNQEISPRTLQKGEGILVKHKISKQTLLSLLPFIEPYLIQYSDLYHNPNLNRVEIIRQLNEIESEDVIFFSDLVFIRDNNWAKPYFKWFNYEESLDKFKLVQEFFIPHLAFLNFDYEGYLNNVIEVRWELSYTVTVMYSSDNVEAVVSKAIENLPINPQDKETIREAITKIRIGQSQFRNGLLQTERNSCAFTGISNPKLLIASHVKPWKDSSNIERLDIENGILLTPTFDKLFDKFLITFNEAGTIVWSHNRLDEDTRNKLIQAYPEINNITININDTNILYYNYHREIFNQNENVNQVE